ncbi:MAG: hypothetical protein P8178_13390 [Candidatus Thiodiazotropha sp.]
MVTRHSHRGPDFFAVLLVLVVIGLGMTLAVQVSATDREQVVDTEVVQTLPGAG